MTTATATIARVEDAEGDGRCGHCDREGLRWVVVLSDGSRYGLNCAKKAFGIKLLPADYVWSTGFTPCAEHRHDGRVYVLWSNGRRTNTTCDGRLIAVGGQHDEWVKNGWI